jgi:hypothetical protein
LVERNIQVKLSQVTGTNTLNVTDTEVVVDAVCSGGNPPDFTRVQGGELHRSSHLDKNPPAATFCFSMATFPGRRKFEQMPMRDDTGYNNVKFYF